jgi:3-dehydroquinate dehydratase-2
MCAVKVALGGPVVYPFLRSSQAAPRKDAPKEKPVPGTIMVLNGPNLNKLGEREPHIYGSTTLADIEKMTLAHAKGLGLEVDFRHSNREGELVDWIQTAKGRTSGIIINAGAYSHTSVAILDALLAVEQPVVEVHLSNLFKREEFRHHSYVTRASNGLICGLGAHGYILAVDALAELIKKNKK